MAKACAVCDDPEPFHVHLQDRRIEDYFTVGRGQSAFDAADAWKTRALRAERTLTALTTTAAEVLAARRA